MDTNDIATLGSSVAADDFDHGRCGNLGTTSLIGVCSLYSVVRTLLLGARDDQTIKNPRHECRGLNQTETKGRFLAFLVAIALGALAIFFRAVLAIASFAIASGGFVTITLGAVAVLFSTIFAITSFTLACGVLVAIALGTLAIFFRTVLAIASFAIASGDFVAITLSAVAIFLCTIFAIASFTITCVRSNVQRSR